MSSKKFFLLSMLVIAGLLLAACGVGISQATNEPSSSSEPQPEATKPASGGELQLDPANAASDEALAAAGYLYEGLVRMQDGNPTGALAESFTVSEDGLDYIFNLRPGVTFHDGSVFNADVMILNFNRWFDPNDANRGSGEFSAWAANFGGFKGDVLEDGKPKSQYDGIEKVNDLTVIIHLNTQDPDLPTKLSDVAFSMVSPKAFEAGDGGTGPYKFSASSDSSLTLEPFAGYWDTSAIPEKSIQVPIK